MYLVDTNVLLEALLEQEKADTVRSLFRRVDLRLLAISDFTFHSIGVILFRLDKSGLFTRFFHDMIIDGMDVLSLTSEDMEHVVKTAEVFNLDFDDAYQYVTADLHEL